jgi:hypothetical protein
MERIGFAGCKSGRRPVADGYEAASILIVELRSEFFLSEKCSSENTN